MSNAFEDIPERMFEVMDLYNSSAQCWWLSGNRLEVTYPDKRVIVTPEGYTVEKAVVLTNHAGEEIVVYEEGNSHKFTCNASIQLLVNELVEV